MKIMRICSSKLMIVFIATLTICTGTCWAEQGLKGLSSGQFLYVPAYSNIYIGNTERPFQLTITLSIRNIDPLYPIRLLSVKYHETKGQLIKAYLTEPITLEPLETIRYIVPEKDTQGGSGANFMVRWDSEKPVNPPVVESVMIGSRSQQGISFTSRGKEIIPHE